MPGHRARSQSDDLAAPRRRDAYLTDRAPVVASATNSTMRPMRSSPSSSGTWPWSATSMDSIPAWRARHGRHRRRRQNVGIFAADDQHGHARQRVEFVPQRRQRALDVDAGERAGQSHIVGRPKRAVAHLPGALRGGEPLLGGELGKLRRRTAGEGSRHLPQNCAAAAACRRSS